MNVSNTSHQQSMHDLRRSSFFFSCSFSYPAPIYLILSYGTYFVFDVSTRITAGVIILSKMLEGDGDEAHSVIPNSHHLLCVHPLCYLNV